MASISVLDNQSVALLRNRSNPDKIREAYVSRTVEQMANEWQDAQRDLLSSSDYAEILNRSKFTVNNNVLIHQHSASQRYIDMKRWYGKRRTPIKVHNTQMFIAFNRLIFRLRYGFTELTKQQIAQNLEM